MTTETSTSAIFPGAEALGKIHFGPGADDAMELYEHEIATYLRELPRLLKEGNAWKHALVKGDDVLSVWDTQADAIQAGRERFGLDPIFVKTINPRDPGRFTLLEAAKEAPCRP